jgi:hypothetical protein
MLNLWPSSRYASYVLHVMLTSHVPDNTLHILTTFFGGDDKIMKHYHRESLFQSSLSSEMPHGRMQFGDGYIVHLPLDAYLPLCQATLHLIDNFLFMILLPNF